MNKVEAAYSMILEARKRAGEILRYEWEGITLRWPDGMAFTPDFSVFGNQPSYNEDGDKYPLTFIETKGPWIEEDAKVKFRAARAHWPEFTFEMWQQDKSKNWKQLL